MRVLCSTLLALFLAPVFAAPAAPADPAQSKAAFEQIASHLDTGGDLMIVANMDGVIEGAVDLIMSLKDVIPADEEEGAKIKETLARIPAFCQRKGLFAFDGFGMSTVPRADGLNNIKMFVLRDPAAMNTAFWRGVVGGEPRSPTSLKYAPADTVVFKSGTGELRQLSRDQSPVGRPGRRRQGRGGLRRVEE